MPGNSPPAPTGSLRRYRHRPFTRPVFTLAYIFKRLFTGNGFAVRSRRAYLNTHDVTVNFSGLTVPSSSTLDGSTFATGSLETVGTYKSFL